MVNRYLNNNNYKKLKPNIKINKFKMRSNMYIFNKGKSDEARHALQNHACNTGATIWIKQSPGKINLRSQ